MGRPARRVPLALVLVLVACGCAGEDEPGTDAASAALLLFEVARIDEPDDDTLAATFELAPGPDNRGALLDALGLLAEAGDPLVVEVLQPEGPADAFVDLTAQLPGGAVAQFNVRLRASEPGSWRVTWFLGPGVEWPARGARRGDGLSSSAPPETRR